MDPTQTPLPLDTTANYRTVADLLQRIGTVNLLRLMREVAGDNMAVTSGTYRDGWLRAAIVTHQAVAQLAGHSTDDLP